MINKYDHSIKKSLIVGDYHCQVSNLKDSQKLMDFIESTAKAQKVDSIFFMGDQFHTHAIIRMEVLNFWHKSLETLSNICKVYVLVGNHDMKGDNESTSEELSSMNIFYNQHNKKNVIIINKPTKIGYIAAIPYRKDADQLIKESKELHEQGAVRCLFAHQTFTGATYENGFYAEDGIDPALVAQEHIVSGHIHKQQIIDKCHYIGTPKWDTMADANQDKGVWVFKYNKDGSVHNKEFISTKDVVTPICKIVIKEGEKEEPLDPNARNYVELHGKTAWISKMKKKYRGKAQVRAKPIDRKTQRLSEHENLSLVEYLKSYFEPIDSVSREEINTYMKNTVQQ